VRHACSVPSELAVSGLRPSVVGFEWVGGRCCPVVQCSSSAFSGCTTFLSSHWSSTCQTVRSDSRLSSHSRTATVSIPTTLSGSAQQHSCSRLCLLSSNQAAFASAAGTLTRQPHQSDTVPPILTRARLTASQCLLLVRRLSGRTRSFLTLCWSSTKDELRYD